MEEGQKRMKRLQDGCPIFQSPNHILTTIIVDPKNKWTLSAPGRFGFLTEPAQDVLLILNFTITYNHKPTTKKEHILQNFRNLSREENAYRSTKAYQS